MSSSSLLIPTLPIPHDLRHIERVEETDKYLLQILWWATRLTFNSPRVFRHMTRLFCSAGDVSLARRTLRLYTTLVAKAYQTRMATASGDASSKNSASSVVEAEEATTDEMEAADVDADADSDSNWIDTLIFGARMLCRPSPFLSTSSTPSTALEDAHEAQDLLTQAQTRLNPADKARQANLKLAEGVAATALALASHDPRTRPVLLRQALESFEKSVEARPSAEGWWHLAVALARGVGEKGGSQRDLSRAVEVATQAVEAWAEEGEEPSDTRYWHLLGLLLSAQGKWAQAKGVLDVASGLGTGEDEENENEDEAVGLTANGNGNGNGNVVQTRDFAAPAPASNGDVTPTESQPLLPPGAQRIPPAYTLLETLPDHPRASRQDAFERALQLRMTQIALAEITEGAEGAALGWVGVFGWVAERSGHGGGGGASATTTREWLVMIWMMDMEY